MEGGSGGGAADFLLRLYRVGRTVDPCGFQGEALKLIAEHLFFDLSIWAMGKPDGPIHSIRHYHHTPHLCGTLLLHKSPRMLLHLLGNLPSEDAVNLDDPMFRTSRAALPHHHACCMVLRDPETGLHHLFMFIRSRTGICSDGFFNHERVFIRCVCPHIVEVGHHILQTHLSDHASDGSTGAIVDRRGLIHLYRPDFHGILRHEWPDWSEPFLPFSLERPKKTGDNVIVNGRKVVMIASALGDLIHLRARLKSRTENLSARERIITKHLLDGLTYKEIARSLGISACTVTKHVNSIYKKLRVRNKAQLANVVRSGARAEGLV